MYKISFIGLGKLGLPLATCLAKNTHDIVGIDINESIIDDLKNGNAPFYEPNLQSNITLASKNIRYTTKYDDVAETDATIILVNTPSNKKDGSFSNIYIEQSLINACRFLKNKSEYHLFIISSTVMPGSINDSFVPLIESITGWKLNKDYGICYIPDFVALGNIIHDFENPEIVVLGQSDQRAGDLALEIYSKIFKNNPHIRKMSLLEGEISKISLNAYICTKISFSNYLSRMCEKFDNVNVDNITSAIGLDKRISPYYFKGGLSFGGTCFPRDTWAFMKFSEKLGMRAHHVEAAEIINQEQDRHLFDKIMKITIDNNLNNEISILGLGFKNNTPVINESSSIKLIDSLIKMNYKIHVYDPIEGAVKQAKEIYGLRLIYHDDPALCVKSTNLCVLINPNDSYLELEQWLSKDSHVLDCWRYLKNSSNKIHKIGLKTT